MSTDFTLGYHELGQFHFFTVLPQAANGLGAKGSFRSPDSFLSLVTTLHETYHVMQDLFMGVCCWMADRNDGVAAAAARGIGKEFLGATATTALARHDTFLHQLIYSSETTHSFLEQEFQAFPDLATVLGSAKNLTGQDLLECHAAILTEMEIARLIQARPEAFDAVVVQDMEVMYRVDQMPLHSRALNAFHRIVGQFTDFRNANARHPLHPQCPRAAEYTLVAFLLDLALHVAPPLTDWGNAGVQPQFQDTFPACRYLKLLFALSLCWQRSIKRGEKIGTNEERLYATLARDLAHRINVSSLRALAVNRRTRWRWMMPDSESLVDLPREKVLRRLKLKDPGDSFLPFEVVTDVWLAQYERAPWALHFPRLHATRLRALRVRRHTPSIFFELRPCVFYARLGIPGFYQTPEGAEGMPPAILIRPLENNEDRNRDPVDLAFSTRELIRGSPKSLSMVFETVGLPYEFVDQVAAHEISLSLAGMLVHGAPMRCPLTDKLAFYSCQARTNSCQRICDQEELPEEHCLAQTLISRLFRPKGK